MKQRVITFVLLASQSDADPFIVLRFAAKHYEWVRCDAAALVEIWTGAAAGKTVGGRGGGTTEVCRTSATDSPLQSPRFMQVSTDSEAECSGQAKAGDPQSLTQADGVEAGPPLARAGFMQVPTDTEAEYSHQAHVAGPQTFMQIDSASEIGTTAHGPAKRPSQDPEVSSATCKRQRKANSVCSLQTCTSAVPTKPNSTTVAAGARKPARDTWTWFCELCRFTVRAPTKGQASQGRNNHLNRVHPSLSKEERAKLHKVSVEAEVVTPYKGELQVGGWMCFKCKRVLPRLSHSDRQASIRMHMKSCYGSRCPSHGENARRVFVSMGGTCNKGKKPSPKAFSTAIAVNNKLRELRETSPTACNWWAALEGFTPSRALSVVPGGRTCTVACKIIAILSAAATTALPIFRGSLNSVVPCPRVSLSCSSKLGNFGQVRLPWCVPALLLTRLKWRPPLATTWSAFRVKVGRPTVSRLGIADALPAERVGEARPKSFRRPSRPRAVPKLARRPCEPRCVSGPE